jgi:hypothetical protein
VPVLLIGAVGAVSAVLPTTLPKALSAEITAAE